MRKYNFLFVFCILFLVDKTASADGCKDPKTPYDKTYCTAKLFLESDKELNVEYKNLKGAIKKPIQAKLTDVQKAWIEFRDKKCSEGGTINVGCNFEVNQSRTNFLRDRFRECKTGHCDEAKITEKSWESS